MSELERRGVYPVDLQTRQLDGRRILSGLFPFNQAAIVSDRGRRRKELFRADANGSPFTWQLREFALLQSELSDLLSASIQDVIAAARADPLADLETRQLETPAIVAARAALASRNVDLLSGHSFDKPLASMIAGTLELTDGPDGLRFEATLPPDADQPTWMVDTVRAVDSGLARGVSPGFRMPPPSVVANAETEEPEPGNPGVTIRVIRQALLPELSIVTRPSYSGSSVELRADAPDLERYYRWL